MAMSESIEPIAMVPEPLTSHVLVTGETGAQELRRVVSCLNSCAESAIDAFTAEEIIKLVRACWASGWDIWPDNLTDAQVAAVLETGEVPCFFESSRGLVALPVRLARARWDADRSVVDLVMHEYLCHRDRGCQNAPSESDDYAPSECGASPDLERLAALAAQLLKEGGV
jgi:hypothetical protein